MLLFFLIISVILIMLFIIIFSEIKLIVKSVEITNKENKNEDFKCRLGLYFLGKIKWLSINLNNKKLKNIVNKEYINKFIKIKNSQENSKLINKKYIKCLIKNIKIDKLNLKMCVDAKNVILTSYLVAIISIIISYIIKNNAKKVNKKYHTFQVLPIYKNQNYIYVKLNCIISIKVVHIINMIKLMGGNKNERTSNRRVNINCYGKH